MAAYIDCTLQQTGSLGKCLWYIRILPVDMTKHLSTSVILLPDHNLTQQEALT